MLNAGATSDPLPTARESDPAAEAAASRPNPLWQLPSGAWVLHSTPLLGFLTERWIDIQARSGERFESRLLGLETAPDATREPHWLVAADRLDLKLAYRGMFKSGGLSPVWLAREFRASPPSGLHVHYGPPAAQLRHLARKLDCPLIASFYGADATMTTFTEGRLSRARYKRLFRDATAFIVEGPAMAERVIALGAPAEKMRVIRLPADEQGLSVLERRDTGDFVVVAAGRFAEKKGFDTAIRAFARAFRGCADARLLMVGGGELESDLRRLAVAERVDGQVDWKGRLPFDQFMGEVSAATVAVYPSRRAANGDSEGGAPVTLIESQWLGVPGIVSDHDDLPFVAAPQGSVVLPATDIDLWAEALLELYRRPSLAAEMGVAAMQFVREHHSLRANVTAREAVYSEIGGR